MNFSWSLLVFLAAVSRNASPQALRDDAKKKAARETT